MRHGTWEPFVRAALDSTRRCAEAATREARVAEDALSRRMTRDSPPEAITLGDLREDPGLRDARERFRARHRAMTALRDECAGFETDLEMMGAGSH